MNQNIKIAVFGGSGRTGKYLIIQLIKKGYGLKIFSDIQKPLKHRSL